MHRLVEVCRRAARQGTVAGLIAVMAGHDDNRDSQRGLSQASLNGEAIHARHLQVKSDAAWRIRIVLCQEVLGRKRLDDMPCRTQEARDDLQ